MVEPGTSSIQTPKSRFERHASPFTPGMLVGLGLSIYSMKQMVSASGRKDALAFQKYQRWRMFSSFGAIACFIAGYIYNNTERLKGDFEELKHQYWK